MLDTVQNERDCWQEVSRDAQDDNMKNKFVLNSETFAWKASLWITRARIMPLGGEPTERPLKRLELLF